MDHLFPIALVVSLQLKGGDLHLPRGGSQG